MHDKRAIQSGRSPVAFNVTEYENFTAVSDFILQLTFKKLLFVEFGFVLKNIHNYLKGYSNTPPFSNNTSV